MIVSTPPQRHRDDERSVQHAALKNAGEHDPLRRKATEGWKAREHHAAHDPEPRRDRHPLRESAHLAHVAKTGRVDDDARCREEHRLSHDVAQEEEHPAFDPRRGEGTQAEHRVGDLADGRARREALDVGLGKR